MFINPDIIAAGISPFNTEKAAFHAGRIMLTRIQRAIEQGESFAFESTLSGKTWAPILSKAIEKGYQIDLYFLYLEKVTDNIKRIKARVKSGGHFIPRDVVLRRYPKAFLNFWNVYRPLASDWFVFNNSAKKPKLVMSRQNFQALNHPDQLDFEKSFLKGKEE